GGGRARGVVAGSPPVPGPPGEPPPAGAVSADILAGGGRAGTDTAGHATHPKAPLLIPAGGVCRVADAHSCALFLRMGNAALYFRVRNHLPDLSVTAVTVVKYG